ncbi:uncharacterized protein LOC125685557 [Lagopus muta]|uniref:uncharacterized protein LOC125685557 n=1 Tax=Lagopus muta TaxID=64668 RepID=UPI00209D8EFC|nr:uncharacterized protein LOC125685557 [Lagopus muta]
MRGDPRVLCCGKMTKAAQCGAARLGTARRSPARHSVAQSGIGTVQRGTERHRHGAAWHSTALRGRGIATPWCCLSGRNAAHVHPHSSSCARQQLISGQQRSSAQGKRGGSALPRVGEGADRQNVFASGCKSCRTIAGNLLYKCRQGIATNNRSEGRHGGNREARALISGRCLNNGRAAKKQTAHPRDTQGQRCCAGCWDAAPIKPTGTLCFARGLLAPCTPHRPASPHITPVPHERSPRTCQRKKGRGWAAWVAPQSCKQLHGLGGPSPSRHR